MQKTVSALLCALVTGALAMGARYALIQPPEIAHLCDATGAPWWCSVRLAVILTYARYELGYLALVACVVTLVWRNFLSAGVTLSLGVAAIVLYCYEPGALAITVGSLALARLARSAAPAARALDAVG